MSFFEALLVTVLLLSSSSASYATVVNVTVDDNAPDPRTGLSISYAPSGEWSFGPTCLSCDAAPDPTQAFDGTWHEVSFLPAEDASAVQTATLFFNGTAVYVYCILAPTDTALGGNTELAFYLDGQIASLFSSSPGPTYQYNVLVYANVSIPPGLHTLSVQNGRAGGLASLTLLDYMIYSTEDDALPLSSAFALLPSTPSSILSPPSGSSTTPPANGAFATGAPSQISYASHKRTVIIAVVSSIGGLLLLASVAVGLILYCKRRRRSRGSSERPYSYGVPPQPNISDDPTTSGWVDGTWDFAGNMDASSSSLTQTSPRRMPSVLRGGTLTGSNGGSEITTESQRRTAPDWTSPQSSTTTSYLVPHEPGFSATSMGLETSMQSMRHPYATSGSASRIADDDRDGVAVVDVPKEKQPVSSAPPAAPERRPSQQSAMLASQADAARARRQNSTRSTRTVPAAEPPPPPYEGSWPRRF